MSAGSWARDIADTYNDIARTSKDPQVSEANAAEASKYYGIAARMDAAMPEKEHAGA
jgi:hypothetical protein